MSANEADKTFLKGYLQRYQASLLDENERIFTEMAAFRDIAVKTKSSGKKLIFAGNGASASICSHFSVDFTKQAKVRAINFNEGNLLTCFGNDYGYENWVVEALKAYADEGDAVVLVSSSGRSPNIVKAAEYAKSHGHPLVSFSGFEPDNPLRKVSDIGFWVQSRSYNVIECTHMIWGTMVIDLLVGQIEYAVV